MVHYIKILINVKLWGIIKKNKQNEQYNKTIEPLPHNQPTKLDVYNMLVLSAAKIVIKNKYHNIKKIEGYINFVANLEHSSGRLEKILDFIHRIWLLTKKVIVSNNILKLIDALDLTTWETTELIYGYGSQYPYVKISIKPYIAKYSFLFIKQYDKYSFKEQKMNCTMTQIFLQIINKSYIRIFDELLELCFQRKNIYCITKLLEKKHCSPNCIVKHLIKYDEFIEELNCKLSTYLIDNYTECIINNIVTTTDLKIWCHNYSYNGTILHIIRKYFENMYFNHYDEFYSLLYYIDEYNCERILTCNILSDILFDVAIKYKDIKTFLLLSDSNPFFRIRNMDKYKKIEEIKSNFMTHMNINILYPSLVFLETVHLLCLIAKDNKYKKNGFKYLIREIIKHLYGTL